MTNNTNSGVKKQYSNFDDAPPSVSYVALLVFMACTAAILHRYHLAMMFENDRHFSHLSSIERELTFQTEMGFYYSYYKTLIDAPSFWFGIDAIVHDNSTEYPVTINSLKRFNIYPEVFVAIGYRLMMKMMSFLGLPTKQCWNVVHGNGLSAVVTCEGIGEPIYFYVESAFFLNGLLIGILFLFGIYLSGSIVGGVLTLLCFFYNHTDCTRVQWSPALRESFAYPFCILQMFVVTFIIRSRNVGLSDVIIVAFTTLCFLLPWQFAQFAVLTQMMSLFGLYVMRFLTAQKVMIVASGILIAAFVQCVMMFGNKMIIASYLVSSCIVSLIMVSLKSRFSVHKFRLFFEIGVMILGTMILKAFLSCLLQVQDDVHIFHILLSKFTSFKTFDTMLYTCAAEFDFLPFETLVGLMKTLLLPMAIFSLAAIGLLTLTFHKSECPFTESGKKMNCDGDFSQTFLLFHVLQLAGYSIMAFLFMRLKLFWTPHLCLMSSLLASPLLSHIKLFQWLTSYNRHQMVLIVVVAIASVQGFSNIYGQIGYLGEFNNLEMKQLIQWINKNTSRDAVFAGSMPTMAAVKLCTGHPIVNHPHYEDVGLRERTKKVYSLFSRKSVEEVWTNMMYLKVDYVINEQSWCTGRSRSGCSLADIWDLEDEANAGRSPVCERLHKKPEPYFQIAYQNHVYDILEVVKEQADNVIKSSSV